MGKGFYSPIRLQEEGETVTTPAPVANKHEKGFRFPSKNDQPRQPIDTPPPAKYPWFVRHETTGIRLRQDPYVIDKIPDIGTTPTINWMQVLAAPATLLVIAIVMTAVGGTYSMLMMLPLQLVGAVTAIANYSSQKKKYSSSNAKREKAYQEYLEDVKSDLEAIAQEQRRGKWQTTPLATQCPGIIEKQENLLWAKNIHKNDFLEIALGVGSAELCCPIEVYRPGRFEDQINYLANQAVSIADSYKRIDGIPVSISLRENSTVAVVGDPLERCMMLQQMLLTLCTTHSPEDLKIVLVYSEEEKAQWSFFRFLPHVWDTDHNTRYVAEDYKSAENLLNRIAEMTEARKQDMDGYHSSLPSPWYVLVVTDQAFLNDVINAERLFPHSFVGLTTLVSCEYSIPSGCRYVIDVQQDQTGGCVGKAYQSSQRNYVTEFRPVHVDPADLECAVRRMSPIRLAAGKEGKGMPPFLSLFKGRGVNSPEELRIADSWSRFRAAEGMAVSMGVGSDGKEVIFDIHEKRDGPMGVIAGTTRAGKTELIQSWIMQMASKFSPEEVNFVLFDFKGTSLIDPLKDLPHFVGGVSNTASDDSGQDFELRYCTALNSEILRRQNLFTLTGTTNILEYHKKYQNKQVAEPLPFLMIILDEFARIKDAHPDFMKLANSLYATGGSLGMYVLLSTQNPASAISPEIRANSAFQWCARVADTQDSREMIGVPDAAHLPKIPGRAFLRVRAQGTLQCFQSYYAGAGYDPVTRKSENAMPTALIKADGTVLPAESKKSDCTEIQVTVEHICRTAEQLRIPAAHKVWLPPLDKQIRLYDLLGITPGEDRLYGNAPKALTAIVGRTDDPAKQTQYLTEIPFAQFGSAMVCGGPTAGKTTFLLTAALSLVHQYSPENIRMYYLDGGNGSLKCMEKYPHTARAFNVHLQSGDCAEVLQRLQNEVKLRQQKLAARGVSDLTSYCTLTGQIMPEILLVIDDIGELRKSMESSKLGSACEIISFLTKFGPANGMYLLISACKQADLYKIADNIHTDMRFVLHMPEKSDVKEILHLPGYPPVITIPGRGICSKMSAKNRVFVFQTAIPWTTENEAMQLSALRSLGEEMAQSYGKSFDDQPVEVPNQIPFGSLCTDKKEIVLGLALDGRGIVGHYADADTAVMTLTGSDTRQIEPTMAMILRQVKADKRYRQIIVLDVQGNMEAQLEQIKREAMENQKKGSESGRCFLVIQNFPSVYNRLDPNQKTLLDKLLTNGGKIFGMDFLLTGSPDKLASLEENSGGVIPARITLFRRPMLYLDSSAVNTDRAFKVPGISEGSLDPEDAEYVTGMEDGRSAIRIRRMRPQ